MLLWKKNLQIFIEIFEIYILKKKKKRVNRDSKKVETVPEIELKNDFFPVFVTFSDYQ